MKDWVMEWIDKENLYGNTYNASALCEYTKELELMKQLLDVAEEAVEKQCAENTWSYEGICYSFAKTIVDYSKMAYDNMLLGHFHAVKMISRSILENRVCLDIIINNKEQELWKYYWVYSYRNAIYKSGRNPKQNEVDLLNELYENLSISKEFYVKQRDRKKAYIQEPYGWTYKINKNKKFSFQNICRLLEEEAEYHGFQLKSDYSHGTTFYLKLYSSVVIGDMMAIFIDLYIELYRMIIEYCWDKVDESFDWISEDIEEIFYRYIDYEEEHFG